MALTFVADFRKGGVSLMFNESSGSYNLAGTITQYYLCDSMSRVKVDQSYLNYGQVILQKEIACRARIEFF